MIVGGKHEGSDGMEWKGDGDHERPPKRIMVGTCPGRGECAGGSRTWCRTAAKATVANGKWARGRGPLRHPAYWTPDEQALALVPLPIDCQPYRLSNVRTLGCNCCRIPKGTHAPECDSNGSEAVYVIEGAPGTDALTVADILAAAPRLPAPATAAARDAAEGVEKHRRHFPRTERCLCVLLDALGQLPTAGRPRGWAGW